MAARKKAARSGAQTKSKSKPKLKAKAKAVRKATSSAAKAPKRASSAKRPLVKKAAAKAAPKRKATARKAARGQGRATAQASQGFPEISELAELMDQHSLVEVEYERSTDGATRIHVKRAGAYVDTVAAPAAATPSAPVHAAAVPVAAEVAAPAPVQDDNLHAFKSPMVGTFYRAPSPEASSFASVGDSVEVGNTVCIIEAMKVMNEITPDESGEVVSIEVENGEAVEFGQTLMLIRRR